MSSWIRLLENLNTSDLGGPCFGGPVPGDLFLFAGPTRAKDPGFPSVILNKRDLVSSAGRLSAVSWHKLALSVEGLCLDTLPRILLLWPKYIMCPYNNFIRLEMKGGQVKGAWTGAGNTQTGGSTIPHRNTPTIPLTKSSPAGVLIRGHLLLPSSGSSSTIHKSV